MKSFYQFINFNSKEYTNTTVPVTILSEPAEMQRTLMDQEFNILKGIPNNNISGSAKGSQEEMDIKKNLRMGRREVLITQDNFVIKVKYFCKFIIFT